MGLTPFLFPTTRIGLYIMVRVDAAVRGWQATRRLGPAAGDATAGEESAPAALVVAKPVLQLRTRAACRWRCLPTNGSRPGGANLPRWHRPPRLRALTGAARRRSRRPAAACDAAGAAKDASFRAPPMDAQPDMVCLME